jgi:hypothetical protein
LQLAAQLFNLSVEVGVGAAKLLISASDALFSAAGCVAQLVMARWAAFVILQRPFLLAALDSAQAGRFDATARRLRLARRPMRASRRSRSLISRAFS